jgi:hypothetical protein
MCTVWPPPGDSRCRAARRVVPQLRHAAAGGAGAGGDEAVAWRQGMMGAMSPLMFNYQP